MRDISRIKNPLLKEYVKEVQEAMKNWMKKTGREYSAYKHPVSFFQWKKGRAGRRSSHIRQNVNKRGIDPKDKDGGNS